MKLRSSAHTASINNMEDEPLSALSMNHMEDKTPLIE